mmetsp:Transcript_159071/g.486840  ORF Transcript_159071/g.486840 Transcript_159071/m.486840 type:complete len:267 (+) Transcript_159071:304-1104(+)
MDPQHRPHGACTAGAAADRGWGQQRPLGRRRELRRGARLCHRAFVRRGHLPGQHLRPRGRRAPRAQREGHDGPGLWRHPHRRHQRLRPRNRHLRRARGSRRGLDRLCVRGLLCESPQTSVHQAPAAAHGRGPAVAALPVDKPHAAEPPADRTPVRHPLLHGLAPATREADRGGRGAPGGGRPLRFHGHLLRLPRRREPLVRRLWALRHALRDVHGRGVPALGRRGEDHWWLRQKAQRQGHAGPLRRSGALRAAVHGRAALRGLLLG